MTIETTLSPARPAVARATVRRQLLLDSAVKVVAASGLRGLTHRAVDARAELAEGTTSAYFRTRMALLSALADHVVAQVSDDVERLAKSLVDHEGEHEYAIAQTQSLIESWVTEWRMLATRLELGIEAARQPELAETLKPWRDHLHEVIQERLCHDGHTDPRLRAQTVVAALDGVLMATLRVPRTERHALATASTRLVLESLLGRPGGEAG